MAESQSKSKSKSRPKVVKVAKVVVYRDSAGEWRWQAVASNGKVVADSAEGYRNRPYARKMALDLYPDALVEWGPR